MAVAGISLRNGRWPGWPGAIYPLILFLLSLAISCFDGGVSEPKHDNPLDELNPELDGDPFQLDLTVTGSGVALTWIVPEPLSVHHFAIQRLVDNETEAQTVLSNQIGHSRGWTDETVENGHTYYYRLLAYDAAGGQTDQSLLRPIRIDLRPIITLADGAALVNADSVAVQILSTLATEMRMANQADLSAVAWRAFVPELVWQLATGEGDCEVFCQVRYETDEASTVESDQIIKDLSPPLIENEIAIDVRWRRVTADAESTTDPYGVCPAESLYYRWQWGDGTTDEGWDLRQKTHFYPGPARWPLILEVTDWAGWVSADTQYVALQNRVPSEPILLSPEPDAHDISIEPMLMWRAASDEEFDPLRYLVYLGESEPLELLVRDISDTTSLTGTSLLPGTTYWWRIDVIDVWGGINSSRTGQFETELNAEPTTPLAVCPVDGEVDVSLVTRLEWTPSFDYEGGEILYDVYFGENEDRRLIVHDLAETSCHAGVYYNADSLKFSESYSWYVVARDLAGNESESEIWHFSTFSSNLSRMGGVLVAGFEMGDDETHCGIGDVSLRQEVLLTTDFYMNFYEVTNLEYLAFLESQLMSGRIQASSLNVIELDSPSQKTIIKLSIDFQPIAFLTGKFSVAPVFENNPVVGVTWYGAALFCNWLSEREGLSPAYDLTEWRCYNGDPYEAAGYRLPTSAEWEFVAQYPDGRLYPWGDEDPYITYGQYRANYAGHYDGLTPVGSFPEGMSAHGFYDMAGNVYEWCDDYLFCEAIAGVRIDPIGEDPLRGKVLRGGEWAHSYNLAIRCTARHALWPETGHGTIGFRVVRSMVR